MAALGPKARALIDAGRSALRPAAGDRDRLEAALRARLGPAALPPQASVAPPPIAAAAGWKVVAGTAIGVGLAVALVYLAAGRAPSTRAEQAPASRPEAAAIASPPPAAPLPGIAATTEIAPSPAPPVAAPSEASAAPAPRSRDRLAEEVALLSRATTALRSGNAAEALKALDEHQSKFPHGVLTEERRAARAQALCSLGRMSEGRAELARLAPQSPAAARARKACD